MPKPGQRGDEIWMRCPFCGDSPNPDSVHYSIHRTKRIYHCLRCSASGSLSTTEFVNQTGMLPGLVSTALETVHDPLDVPILPGPGSSRSSGLDRYHLQGDQITWDCFLCKTPKGEVEGVSLRGPNKRSINYGRRGLGYAGDELIADWVRLVEGPYDVVDPAHDVCTFGMPTQRQLKMLRAYPLVLCPDGDVWNKPVLLAAYLAPFLKVEGLLLQDIEILPGGRDPDEVKMEHRTKGGAALLVRLFHAIAKGDPPREFRAFPNYLPPRLETV